MGREDGQPIVTLVDWGEVEVPRFEELCVLALPVLSYDVLLTEPRTHGLNMLQESVLEMSRLGVIDPERTAEYLHLEPTLVSVVLDELSDLGLVTDRRAATDHGRALAIGERPDRMQPALVLRDPFTRRIWPSRPKRSGSNRPTALRSEWHDGDAFLALRRTTKAIRRVPMPATSSALSAPPVEQMLRSLSPPGEPVDEQLWESIGDLSVETTGIGGVELISDLPDVLSMPVVYYVEEGVNGVDGVKALGLDGQQSGMSLDVLHAAAREDRAARHVLSLLENKVAELAAAPASQQRKLLRSQVADQVDGDLIGMRSREPELWDQVVTLRTRLVELNSESGAGAVRLEDVATNAGRVCEGVAHVMSEANPLRAELASLFERDDSGTLESSALEDAVESWGNGSVPHELIGATSGWGVAGQLRKCVLAAHSDDGHILRRMLERDPDWLRRMVGIAKVRNQAGAHFAQSPQMRAGIPQAAADAIELAELMWTELCEMRKESSGEAEPQPAKST